MKVINSRVFFNVVKIFPFPDPFLVPKLQEKVGRIVIFLIFFAPGEDPGEINWSRQFFFLHEQKQISEKVKWKNASMRPRKKSAQN